MAAMKIARFELAAVVVVVVVVEAAVAVLTTGALCSDCNSLSETTRVAASTSIPTPWAILP